MQIAIEVPGLGRYARLSGLKSQVQMLNIPGMRVETVLEAAPKDTLGAGEQLPLLQLTVMTLSPIVVKQLFEVIKIAFEYQKEKLRIQGEIEKARINHNKIKMTMNAGSKKKISLEIDQMDDRAEEKFVKVLDKFITHENLKS